MPLSDTPESDLMNNALNLSITEEKAEVLRRYREAAGEKSEPLSHDALAAVAGTPLPDWDDLLRKVLDVSPGPPGANMYHRAVQDLLTALFYPALDHARREEEIHEGRKRIDIFFANLASEGFFSWVNRTPGVVSANVVVECKNYTKAVANPEYDQITSRFATRRGNLGMLLYRGYGQDKAEVVQHFRDAALDGRGFVIALDDEDLKVLVNARKDGEETPFKYLRQRFLELI
ncbi:hypothetical protein HRF29_05580 [Rathayibacter agropyri]|nr:hypothetical protein [Rathayibacter agropyri]